MPSELFVYLQGLLIMSREQMKSTARFAGEASILFKRYGIDGCICNTHVYHVATFPYIKRLFFTSRRLISIFKSETV